jgi:uncharacterized protein YkwD
MRRFACLLLLLVWIPSAGCGGSDAGGVPNAGLPPDGQGTGIDGIDEIRQAFVDAVNAARSTGRMCGATRFDAAPPVSWNDSLAMAAYLHSYDMATHASFSHTGSDGSSPGDRITREGYAWSTYGENIAVNYPAVAAVMQGWLGSEGHCRNIMNPSFREIGAAYVDGVYMGLPSAPYWTFDLAATR